MDLEDNTPADQILRTRLPGALKIRLFTAARRIGRSASDIVRRSLVEYLERNGH